MRLRPAFSNNDYEGADAHIFGKCCETVMNYGEGSVLRNKLKKVMDQMRFGQMRILTHFDVRIKIYSVTMRNNNNIPAIEVAMQKVGFGLYHKFLLAFASLNSLSGALISTILPFVIPLMTCDFPMTTMTLINVSIAYSIGLSLGGFVLCFLGDIFGRKYLIPILSGLIFASTLACSFVHGPVFLMFFLFTLGSGIQSSIYNLKILLAESLPMKKRGFFLVFVDVFWSAGYFFAILFAWGFSPLAINNYERDARFFTWRIMCAASSVFSIILGCTSNLLKPSTRFLLYIGQYTNAHNNLKTIYAINNSRNCEQYSIKEEELLGQIRDYGITRNLPPRLYFEHACSVLRILQKYLKLMVSRTFIFRVAILILLKCVMMCGIFITNMWLYKSLEQKTNCRIKNIDVLYLDVPSNNGKCDLKINNTSHRDFTLLALNILTGQIFLLILVERIGRKILIMFACVLGGACSLTLAFLENTNREVTKIAISSIFLGSYSLLDSVLNIVTIEAFPTAVRGTTAGVVNFVSNVLCLILKKYLDVPCSWSFMFFGTIMPVTAALTFFLPEFKGRPMME